MTEKLALEQRFRDGCAIDLDQRAGGARAPGVDHVGEHFLAHTAFAGEQDTAFRRSNQRRIAKQCLHQWTAGDDVIGQSLVLAQLQGCDRGEAGRLPDRSQQFVEIDRFGEIIDRTVAHGADGFADIGICRYQQDRQHGVFLTRAAEGFQTGNAGHSHVGNHHVEFPAAQDSQRLFAGSNRDGIEALTFQERIQKTALTGIVIDNQDARRPGSIVAGVRGHVRKPSQQVSNG